MTKLNQIPPAALEAGREAFLECDVNPSYSFDDVLSAAFLAMIEAWEGVWIGPMELGEGNMLILPLPLEKK